MWSMTNNPAPPTPSDAPPRPPEDLSREAFMAAIVKLADDEAFRTSFLRHYHLFLHPPMVVTPDFAGVLWNSDPGGITLLTDEQMKLAGWLRPSTEGGRFVIINGVLTEIDGVSPIVQVGP